jgi:hypothetical protein
MDEHRQQMIQHYREGHRNDTTGFRGERHHFRDGMMKNVPDPSFQEPPRFEDDSINSINNK